ncbi:MAG: hemolysin [Brevundimonas sp.]|uniref:hemolysin n=1 Tax=Brevundimonas sp. TaxID=1871086 RepID=UPI002487874D|nr:hemolysin [Brevundimonas sp.]MDI1326314.1 hemolysin [Brevundimonas sp.]
MKTLILALAATGLLAACAPAPVDNGASTPTPGNNAGSSPVPPPDGLTRCRADEYQRYVGRNRSELPPKPANENWRVTCTTCPVTMDYSGSRLNIFYDERTGIIREVKCG